VTTDLGRTLARHWILAVPVLLGLLLRIGSDAGLGGSAAVGLLTAVAAYVLCVRWGCWRWLAALAVLPAVADDRVLRHQDLRPTLALLLLGAGLVILCWGARGLVPAGVRIAGAVGTILGAALSGDVAVTSGDPGVLSFHLAVPGGLLLAAVGLLGALGLGRSREVDLRLVCAVLVAVGVPNALTTVVWWPVAGVLGATALLRGRRGRSVARPQVDPVDEEALAGFHERYGTATLGPVAVVIAAYNEADGIPAVLAHLPAEVCELQTDVVVVDDGSTDGTGAALEHSPAYVVTCRTNRGQGAALRLGYRVARDAGATYLVTTDADGQYSVDDLPAVLTPLLADRADFVSGSRILGHQQTRDRVRRAGVHVFAWLATVLTGHRFTDTSFGLRAMRAEVTAVVTLNQPQYQSSELLLGVVSHGYRVLEVPASMNLRSAGSTKKGRNLVYGRRYARAMIGTWLREGLPRPVTETAPALRHTRGHGD
jgi:Glycosyl transferase family 2